MVTFVTANVSIPSDIKYDKFINLDSTKYKKKQFLYNNSTIYMYIYIYIYIYNSLTNKEYIYTREILKFAVKENKTN